VLVSPTEQGLRLFDRLTAEIKALHRRQWGLLDKDELRELIRLLNKARFSGNPGNPARPSSHLSTGSNPRAD
jgi:DNA-binding MarR family transcriptional regulator